MQARSILAVAAVLLLSASAARSAPKQDRDRPAAPATSLHAPPPQARVDINSASIDELMKVPGMTRIWAARIVRFRPYRTKLDLLERGVVSAPVYNRIKDDIIAHKPTDH